MNISTLLEQLLKPDVIDDSNPNDIYLGYFRGLSTKCLIKRITKTDSITTIKYPFGRFDFVFNWADRAIYNDWRYRDFPAEITNELVLTWDDIANMPVANATSVDDWNTLFDLPTNGTAFTSVIVTGSEVNLIGGSGITLKASLFAPEYTGDTHILSIEDNTGCVVSVGEYCFFNCVNLAFAILPNVENMDDCAFYGCSSLVEINYPFLETLGSSCFLGCANLVSASIDILTIISEFTFSGCTSLNNIHSPVVDRIETFAFQSCTSLIGANFSLATYVGDRAFKLCSSLMEVNLNICTVIENECFGSCPALRYVYTPVCANFGGSVGNNNVFINTIGNAVNLTIPVSLMTCNGGAPDGDIAYLIANNSVEIITV